MRKQTIEERVREFRKWQEDGAETNKVLRGTPYGAWDYAAIPSWRHDEFVWLFIDEFIDLKKAWYEGKNLQVKRINGWKDWLGTEIPNFKDTPENYRIKPDEWYYNIPPQGILCWVWDADENKDRPKIIRVTRYRPEWEAKFASDWYTWEHAEPLTREEALQMIWEEQND